MPANDTLGEILAEYLQTWSIYMYNNFDIVYIYCSTNTFMIGTLSVVQMYIVITSRQDKNVVDSFLNEYSCCTWSCALIVIIQDDDPTWLIHLEAARSQEPYTKYQATTSLSHHTNNSYMIIVHVHNIHVCMG